jgi:hypothetical protein
MKIESGTEIHREPERSLGSALLLYGKYLPVNLRDESVWELTREGRFRAYLKNSHPVEFILGEQLVRRDSMLLTRGDYHQPGIEAIVPENVKLTHDLLISTGMKISASDPKRIPDKAVMTMLIRSMVNGQFTHSYLTQINAETERKTFFGLGISPASLTVVVPNEEKLRIIELRDEISKLTMLEDGFYFSDSSGEVLQDSQVPPPKITGMLRDSGKWFGLDLNPDPKKLADNSRKIIGRTVQLLNCGSNIAITSGMIEC